MEKTNYTKDLIEVAFQVISEVVTEEIGVGEEANHLDKGRGITVGLEKATDETPTQDLPL